MGSFSQFPLQGMQGVVTQSGQTSQPKYGQPQQFTGQPQTQQTFDMQPSLQVLPRSYEGNPSATSGMSPDMPYTNTIDKWDNPQQSIQKQMPYGKGSSTASSKLPSPLTNNYSMGGKGKGA